MKIKFSNRFSQSVRRGFSLVEVVLAVGIMSLGVVTILGLLPHGLELSRKTANEQAETRIVDHIVSELQTINWSTIEPTPQKRYFDDQGLEIQGTGGAAFNIALNYVVEVTTPDPDVQLPANTGNLPASPSLRRVVIKMISAPLADFNFDAPASAVPVKTFTQLVANMGLVQ